VASAAGPRSALNAAAATRIKTGARASLRYDLRDDLRRAVAVAKKEAVGHRVEGRTDEALEAMRELKKLEWQLQHVVDFFDSHRGAVLRG